MKFTGIQSLRGIAALLVLLHHIGVLVAKEKYFGGTIFGDFFATGFRGVDLFFVISGFIMMHSRSVNPDRTALDFAKNRILRVFVPYLPVFLGMTIIYMAVPSIAQGELKINTTYFIQNSLLLPRENLETYVPVVAWSLTYEISFYLIFALTFLSKIRKFIIFFGLWMIACAFGALGLDVLPKLMILDPLNLGFGIGILSYVAVKRFSNYLGTPVFLLSAIAFIILFSLPYDREEIALVDLAFLILSGILCASSTKIPQNFLSKVGDFSYSFYLCHYPVIAFLFIILFKLGAAGMGAYLVTSICLAVSLIASWIYYFIFEKWIFKIIRSK